MITVWSSEARKMHSMIPVMTRRICWCVYCGTSVVPVMGNASAMAVA